MFNVYNEYAHKLHSPIAVSKSHILPIVTIATDDRLKFLVRYFWYIEKFRQQKKTDYQRTNNKR